MYPAVNLNMFGYPDSNPVPPPSVNYSSNPNAMDPQSYVVPINQLQSYSTVNTTAQFVSTGQQVVCENLLPPQLGKNVVRNKLWVDGEGFCMSILVFILRYIICCGFGRAFAINYILRREVKLMKIGNRRLNYLRGGDMEMTCRCIGDTLANVFTLGWWYILGLSHKYYYAKIDERIFWGRPIRTREKKEGDFPEHVLWQPVDNGMVNSKSIVCIWVWDVK